MKPHVAVPAIAALLYRAHSRRSLTGPGLLAALLTAAAHALHPWSAPFALLGVFFLAGTAATRVGAAAKRGMTLAADGGREAPSSPPSPSPSSKGKKKEGERKETREGSEEQRTHVQVLANSVVACVLTLAHAWALRREGRDDGPGSCLGCGPPSSRGLAADVLLVGVVAQYAAVAADTFSSELGILARAPPRLVTAPWRTVARGTNGGVTAVGLLAGLGGAFVVAVSAALLLPFCDVGRGAWDLKSKAAFVAAMTLAGLGGSVLDSLLGAVAQASVVDVRSGKVVEGSGGRKVLVHGKARLQSTASTTTGTASMSGDVRQRGGGKAAAGEVTERRESRRVETGWDVLDNNGVNLAMAASVSVLAMLGACVVWDVPPQAVLRSVVAR